MDYSLYPKNSFRGFVETRYGRISPTVVGKFGFSDTLIHKKPNLRKVIYGIRNTKVYYCVNKSPQSMPIRSGPFPIVLPAKIVYIFTFSPICMLHIPPN